MSALVTVRRAGPGDAAAIGAVHVQAWRESYAGLLPAAAIAHFTAAARTAMWRRAITQGTARGICVAEIDGGIIGFGACADQRAAELHAQGYSGEVTALYVLRAGQRRGAGRLLMAALARRLIAEGDRAMALWVLTENQSARRFYDALGGRVLATHTRPDLNSDETAYGWDDLAALATAASR